MASYVTSSTTGIQGDGPAPDPRLRRTVPAARRRGKKTRVSTATTGRARAITDRSKGWRSRLGMKVHSQKV
jgi:hypothetical protein